MISRRAVNPDKNGERVTEKTAGLSEWLMNTPSLSEAKARGLRWVGGARGGLWAIPRKLGELSGHLLCAVSWTARGVKGKVKDCGLDGGGSRALR